MIVLQKKRIMYVLVVIFVSVFSYIGSDTLSNTRKQSSQTVALPSSNKVVIIDAGHRTE